MFVTITEDLTGEILMQRELAGDEILECISYAKAHCDSVDMELGQPDGYVPNGCGDFTVELADCPQSGSCWDIQSFFYRRY